MKDDRQGTDAELTVPAERRQYPRIPLSLPIHYSIVKKGEDIKKSESINISTGGVLMTTEERIEPGSTIHLTMNMPLPGLSCNCAMLGEIVRCEEKEDKSGFKTAVKFNKIVHHNLNKYKYASLKDILKLEGDEIKL